MTTTPGHFEHGQWIEEPVVDPRLKRFVLVGTIHPGGDFSKPGSKIGIATCGADDVTDLMVVWEIIMEHGAKLFSELNLIDQEQHRGIYGTPDGKRYVIGDRREGGDP